MSSSTTTTYPRIAIIGGGLGGLSLLLTLSRRGVPAVVYERDVAFSARAHLGGSLDLGWESGQRALRENGLQDAFNENSRPEGEEMFLYNASGKVLMHHGGDDDQGPPGPPEGGEDDQGPPGPQGPEDLRPEIDRTTLRKILIDACPAEAIKWDHSLVSVTSLGNGQHELTFTNGTTATCDVLVGADGAHSRIRPLVSPANPFFTGVNGVEVSLAPAVSASPEMREVVAAVGKGTMMTLEDNKMLASQPNGSGRIRTYVFFRAPEDWTVPAEPAAAREALLEKFTGWADWMRKLIEFCDDEAIYPRTLYALPVGHKWAHVPGVTIIGDAAHLMSPFAGAGANLAMLDGLELGLAIVDAVKDGKVDEAIVAFEDKMCARAGRVAGKTMENLEAFISPNAPQSALDRFQVIMTDGEPREG